MLTDNQYFRAAKVCGLAILSNMSLTIFKSA
jgi:hypothetical protein